MKSNAKKNRNGMKSWMGAKAHRSPGVAVIRGTLLEQQATVTNPDSQTQINPPRKD